MPWDLHLNAGKFPGVIFGQVMLHHVLERYAEAMLRTTLHFCQPPKCISVCQAIVRYVLDGFLVSWRQQ